MPQPPNLSYRSLELLCRKQAALTGHEKAKWELEKMAREYKQLADCPLVVVVFLGSLPRLLNPVRIGRRNRRARRFFVSDGKHCNSFPAARRRPYSCSLGVLCSCQSASCLYSRAIFSSSHLAFS